MAKLFLFMSILCLFYVYLCLFVSIYAYNFYFLLTILVNCCIYQETFCPWTFQDPLNLTISDVGVASSSTSPYHGRCPLFPLLAHLICSSIGEIIWNHYEPWDFGVPYFQEQNMWYLIFEPVVMIALESGHKSRPWLNGKHPNNESKVEFALGCSSAHI